LLGGTMQGAFTVCSTVGASCPVLEACCFADGSCLMLDFTDCDATGGTPQGAGSECATTSCPLLEACCLPDGTCVMGTVEACQGLGGTPQGAGTTCGTVTCPQPPQACCMPDGS
jgi:hypothetical protein